MMTYGYLRVSSQGQVEGDGPDRQKAAILKFCEAHRFPEPEFFFEAGLSGTVEMRARPVFMDMLKAIERFRAVLPNSPVCIVVERLDRLARELLVSEMLLAECAKLGIPVYAADHGTLNDLADSGSDPTRKALRQIMEVMAEWEKSALVKKLADARARKKKLTGKCEGRILFGTRNLAESLLRDRIVAMRRGGASYGKMRQILNREGCLNRGKPWSRGALFQVVERKGVGFIPQVTFR